MKKILLRIFFVWFNKYKFGNEKDKYASFVKQYEFIYIFFFNKGHIYSKLQNWGINLPFSQKIKVIVTLNAQIVKCVPRFTTADFMKLFLTSHDGKMNIHVRFLKRFKFPFSCKRMACTSQNLCLELLVKVEPSIPL